MTLDKFHATIADIFMQWVQSDDWSGWTMTVAVVTPCNHWYGWINSTISIHYQYRAVEKKKKMREYFSKYNKRNVNMSTTMNATTTTNTPQIVLHRDLKKEFTVEFCFFFLFSSFVSVNENMAVRNGSWHHEKVLNLTHIVRSTTRIYTYVK